MKHLGDITKISGYDAPVVDVVIGGSPCQGLSVAGKREGLADERSGLFMEQMRIIREMRERDKRTGRTGVHVRPRHMVWENVPGAFTSGKPKGADFAAVLEECIKVVQPQAPPVPVPEKGWPTAGCIYDELGEWSVAWRVLNAQFWGTPDRPLPQRRRRIALVADFGGMSAPEVLFVRNSVSGDFEPFKPKGQAAATDAASGTDSANRERERERADDRAYTLKVRSGVERDSNGKAAGKGALVQTDMAGTIAATQDQYLFQPVGINGISSLDSNAMKSSNPHSGIYEAETSRTLDGNGGNPSCNQGGIAIVEPVTIIDNIGGQAECAYAIQGSMVGRCDKNGPQGDGINEDLCFTLNTVDRHAVVYPVENHPADSRVSIRDDGVVQTLTSRMGTGGGNVPMVCVADHPTPKVDFGGTAYTLNSRDYKNPQVVAMEVMSDE